MGRSAILDRQPAKTPGEMRLYVLDGSEVGIPSISKLIGHLGFAAEPFASWQLDFMRSSIARVNETFNLKLSFVSQPDLGDIPVLGTSQMNMSQLSGINNLPFYGNTWLIMTLGVGLPLNAAGTGFVGSHNDGPNQGWKKIWLHELGHLLGLEHPWDVTSEATPWIADTDFDITSASDTPYAETLMGYTNPDSTWDEWYEPIDLYALANIWGLKGSSSTILNFGARQKINATATLLTPAAHTFNEVTGLAEQTTAKFGLQVQGTASNDHFLNTDATETIDGSAGVDTFVIGANAVSSKIERSSGITHLTYAADSSVSDRLINVERIKFSDKAIAYDTGATENAGKAKLFTGAIAHSLFNDAATLGTILNFVDNGHSDLTSLSQLAIDFGLISKLAGGDSNEALADLVATNLLGQANPLVANMLTGYMDGTVATYSQAQFLAAVAALEVNQQHVGLVGLAQTGMEYVPVAL